MMAIRKIGGLRLCDRWLKIRSVLRLDAPVRPLFRSRMKEPREYLILRGACRWLPTVLFLLVPVTVLAVWDLVGAVFALAAYQKSPPSRGMRSFGRNLGSGLSRALAGASLFGLMFTLGFGQESPMAASPATQNIAGTQMSNQAMLDYFRGHLFPYEPDFFISGSYPAVEIQFSVKYRLFDPDPKGNDFSQFLGHVFASYTQTSFWTLFTSNPYFYDSSYKPDAFIYYGRLEKYLNFADGVRFQTGIEHESNGRGGSGERSINTFYLQPTATWYLNGGHSLWFTLQPRIWLYLSENSNNSDIADYRGYGQFRVALSGSVFQIESSTQVGRADGRVTEQVDMRYLLPAWAKLHLAAQLEYFNGYGETLRDYDLPIRGLRAGICLWYDNFEPVP